MTPLDNSPKATPDKTSRLLLALILLPISLTCLVLSIWMNHKAPQDQQLIKTYRSSPNCISGAPSLTALSPCTFASEQVVSKRCEYYSKDPDEYYLTLQKTASTPHEVRLLGYDLWKQAAVGNSVKTKYWRGHVVTVDAFGDNTMTSANPLYEGHHNPADVPEFAAFSGGFALLFCWEWWGTRAKPEAKEAASA